MPTSVRRASSPLVVPSVLKTPPEIDVPAAKPVQLPAEPKKSVTKLVFDISVSSVSIRVAS